MLGEFPLGAGEFPRPWMKRRCWRVPCWAGSLGCSYGLQDPAFTASYPWWVLYACFETISWISRCLGVAGCLFSGGSHAPRAPEACIPHRTRVSLSGPEINLSFSQAVKEQSFWKAMEKTQIKQCCTTEYSLSLLSSRKTKWEWLLVTPPELNSGQCQGDELNTWGKRSDPQG